MDLQLTKDGKIVIFHDKTLERVCGVFGKISDYCYNDLPPIKIPEHLLDNAKVTKDPESTKIPLFETLLSEFPMYPMQIDVKYGPEELVVRVGNMIKQFNRERFTVWGSFIPSVNELCYKNFGTSIPLFFSLSRLILAFSMYKIGLFSKFEMRESALIMPNFPFLMNSEWLKTLKGRGVSVIVFGSDGTGSINEESQWESARLAGATGICSDCPSNLQEWLKSNPLH
jgi:hypothetical protein